jgi:hypothetical protein
MVKQGRADCYWAQDLPIVCLYVQSYNSPPTSYPIIDTLARDTTVEVTGRALGLNWYRVRLADGGTGYVWARLLQPANQSNGQ